MFQHLLQYFCKYHMFLRGQWSCLYPYNTIFFHHIFVLFYHTKTHLLQFYLYLILIILNKQDFSLIFQVFFQFLLLINFLWKVLLYNSSVLIPNNLFSFFVVTSLMALYFLIFYIVFPKAELFINFKKIFFKIILCLLP